MIIGFCGGAGAGKDTAAGFLAKDRAFARIAFADPMKRFCAEMFGWYEDELWGASALRNRPDPRYRRTRERLVSNDPDENRVETYLDPGLSPREALQTLGTEWGRRCYPDVWVDYAMRVAKRLVEDPRSAYKRDEGVVHTDYLSDIPRAGVAITDVRFANEVAAIRKAGGRVILLKRSGESRGLTPAQQNHPSEVELRSIPLREFDAVIENEGTLDRLREEVLNLFDSWNALQVL